VQWSEAAADNDLVVANFVPSSFQRADKVIMLVIMFSGAILLLSDPIQKSCNKNRISRPHPK
jgi:hypothetical protein